MNVELFGSEIRFTIPFVDDASIENVMHCLCVLYYLNSPQPVIRRRMSLLETVDMRLQLKNGRQGSLVINDSYNSDLESLRIALNFMSQQRKRRKQCLVLSDLEQTGIDEAIWIERVARMVEEHEIDEFIGVGQRLSAYPNKFPTGSKFFPRTENVLEDIHNWSLANKIITLKGARSFAFEKIELQLQEKSHQTVLEIDLNALSENLSEVRADLTQGVKVMAVVKAFSYGAGSHEVASLLQHHNIDYLAVAYTDEGVSLRKAGVSLPIMVMNPEEQSLSALIHYDLEPEIYSFTLLSQFLKALIRHN
jgi:alanine racemase